MKVLIAQGNTKVAEALALNLQNQDCVVEVVKDGEAAWKLLEVFDYDLLISGVALPKLSGIGLCQKLRGRGYQMPVLLMAPNNDVEEKVKGLDAGADDYVVKPFDFREVAARIRALVRRGSSSSPPILTWGALSLDPSSCEVAYQGQRLHPSRKEYCLLELFLRNSNRLFSRSAIVEQLWDFESPPEEETVKAHVKGLRQKLKAAGAPADLIQTVYGLGYRLKSNP